MPQITINIDYDLNDFLMNECEITNRTPDEVVEAALDIYLEDQQDIRIAEDALADIKAGRMGVVSLEEVERRMDAIDASEIDLDKYMGKGKKMFDFDAQDYIKELRSSESL